MTHVVTQFYSPSLLLWSQQWLFRVTTITGGHRPCEVTEMDSEMDRTVKGRSHRGLYTVTENRNSLSCIGRAKDRFVHDKKQKGSGKIHHCLNAQGN